MKEFLIKEISSYENILKIVLLRLNELKELANQYGIETDSLIDPILPNKTEILSVETEMENHRNEMMGKMQKIREDAQRQTEQAMQHAMKQMHSVSNNTPGVGMLGMPMGMPNFEQMKKKLKTKGEK
jgi:hypothetical protein